MLTANTTNMINTTNTSGPRERHQNMCHSYQHTVNHRNGLAKNADDMSPVAKYRQSRKIDSISKIPSLAQKVPSHTEMGGEDIERLSKPNTCDSILKIPSQLTIAKALAGPRAKNTVTFLKMPSHVTVFFSRSPKKVPSPDFVLFLRREHQSDSIF